MTDPEPIPAPEPESGFSPAPESGISPAPSESGVGPAPSESGIGPAEPSPSPEGVPVDAAPRRGGCLGSAAAILLGFIAAGTFSTAVIHHWFV